MHNCIGWGILQQNISFFFFLSHILIYFLAVCYITVDRCFIKFSRILKNPYAYSIFFTSWEIMQV